MKTIVGIATPAGFGGIGIVRLSGKLALDIASKMFSNKLLPRVATLGKVFGENFSDIAIAIFFKAPNSFTGEDVVEIQSHGGWHLVNKIMQTAIKFGCTPAEAGEFTKTAVLNGKMTLTEAESTIDIINAESDIELSNASTVMSGKLHELVYNIENELVSVRAEIDAYLDYPEDLDSPILPMAQIESIKSKISDLVLTAKNGQIIKDGINVSIVGFANAGKSSLFNALIKNNRSIVTSIAGTTTDTITERIHYNGLKINFIDTAGLREGNLSEIENQGIKRSKESINAADILLVVVDATTMELIEFPKTKKHLIIYNKTDVAQVTTTDGICISAKNGTNIDKILDGIINLAVSTPLSNAVLTLTNERHVNALKNALNLLNEINDHQSLDMVSSNVTLALSYIGKITGSNVDDKTLDEIFSKFCLGK